LDSQGNFYRLAHRCPCGSDLTSHWCKDEKGGDVRACERCKPKLLHRIFDEKLIAIFDKWRGDFLLDPPPLGYEWQWEDLLKEKGCEQVVGLEQAKRQWKRGDFLIADPYGETLDPAYKDSADRSVYILVAREYADRVLADGKMV
jgi:hypothetical protein